MRRTAPSWAPSPFGSAEQRLHSAGLPKPLIARAAQLHAGQGTSAAHTFVEFFDALLGGRPLPAFAESDIVRLLDTEEQRVLTAQALKRAIPAVTSFGDLEIMNALLFQLGELGHDDAAVSKFVHTGMQHTLKERTGTFQSRAKHFNYHDARDALLGCKRIFDAADKRFFLDRGTLLGAVREGGFIASDYDIDVGIFADEISLDEVKALFVGTEFELTQDFEFKVGVASPTGIQIDFFLTTRERGYFLSKGYRSIHNWYFTPFELMEYEFLGESFFIPATYEKHLDENYGNWRDAAIFYDLSYNEPCVAYGDGPEAFSYLSKRFGRALRRGWRYYSAAAARGLAESFDVDVRDRLTKAVGPTVRPQEPPLWTPRPILVIGAFETYAAHHRRVLESALSITPDVRIAVVGADGTAPTGDQLTVARAVDRITAVDAAQRSEDGSLDLASLLQLCPRAVILERPLAGLLPSPHVAALLDIECDVAFFEQSTIALNLIDGRVVSR